MSVQSIDKLCSNPSKLSNGGVIQHAKDWFNFDNKNKFPMRISEQVKWQLYHAATSKVLPAGIFVINPEFGTKHLLPEDTARLYRIIDSFQRALFSEKKWGEASLHAKLRCSIENQIMENLLEKNSDYGPKIVEAFAKEEDRKLDLPSYRFSRLLENFANFKKGDIRAKALTFLNQFYKDINDISPQEAANRFYFFMKTMARILPEKEIFQYFFDFHLHGEIAVAPDFGALRLLIDHFNQKSPYQGKLNSVLLVNLSDLQEHLTLLSNQGFNGDKKIMVLHRGDPGGHYTALFLRKNGDQITYIISDSGGENARNWIDAVCEKIKGSKLQSNQMQLISFAPTRQSDGVSCSIAAFRDVLESCKLDIFHYIGDLPPNKKIQKGALVFVQDYPPSFMKFKQSLSYLPKYLQDVPYANTAPVTREGKTLSQVVQAHTVSGVDGKKMNSYLHQRAFKYFSLVMKKILDS